MTGNHISNYFTFIEKISMISEQEETQYISCLNVLKRKYSVELLTAMLQTGQSPSELGWIGLKEFKFDLETKKIRSAERKKVQLTIKRAKYEEERKNFFESKKRKKVSRSIKFIIEPFNSIIEIIHLSVDFPDALEGQLDIIPLKNLESLHQEFKRYMDLFYI